MNNGRSAEDGCEAAISPLDRANVAVSRRPRRTDAANDERHSCALADTGNARHEVKPESEIVGRAQTLGNVTYPGALDCRSVIIDLKTT